MIPALIERLLAVSAARPGRTALRFEGEDWTYERLTAECRTLADRLEHAGARGRRVGIDLPTGPEHVVALLAAAWAGATAVPFDEKWTQAQVAARADLSAVTTVLHDDDGRIGLVPRANDSPSTPDSDVPFLLAATGGTSGVPKAVAIGADATLARFVTQTVDFGFSANTTFLSATPIFHGGGRSFILSQPGCADDHGVLAVS